MSDYLSKLAARSLDQAPKLEPRPASAFEPLVDVAPVAPEWGETGIEIESADRQPGRNADSPVRRPPGSHSEEPAAPPPLSQFRTVPPLHVQPPDARRPPAEAPPQAEPVALPPTPVQFPPSVPAPWNPRCGGYSNQ